MRVMTTHLVLAGIGEALRVALGLAIRAFLTLSPVVAGGAHALA
jgi:hypothetical protein